MQRNRIEPKPLARDGRIEIRRAEDVTHRALNYVTLGRGNDENWWRGFCQVLAANGYDDVLSIEHEDLALPPIEGVAKSVALLRRVIAGSNSSAGRRSERGAQPLWAGFAGCRLRIFYT